MLKLLAKKFIKSPDDFTPETRNAWGMLCGIMGIFLNFLLFVLKLVLGFIANSVAVTADAFNNLSDAGSSAVTLAGFRLASKKPDPDHPFGHGRMEYVSALVVSVAIITMGAELLISSAESIFKNKAAEFSLLSVIILTVSVAVKLYMWHYNRVIGKKIDSSAMRATAKDSISDAFATSAVLLSLVFSHFTGINIDGYTGAAVSLMILYAGLSSIKETVDLLLGQPPKSEVIESIKSIVDSHPEAVGIHDMVIHDYGPGRMMISLHVEVPGNRDIFELHDAIDTIENEIREALNCEAVIHMDPVATDDTAVSNAKSLVINAIKEIDPVISIHDFRMVTGPTHTNLIFDVVLPFSYKYTDDEVSVLVKKAVNGIDETWFAVIKIEKDFVMDGK